MNAIIFDFPCRLEYFASIYKDRIIYSNAGCGLLSFSRRVQWTERKRLLCSSADIELEIDETNLNT